MNRDWRSALCRHAPRQNFIKSSSRMEQFIRNSSSGGSLTLLLMLSLRTGASSILSATWLHTYTRYFSPSASFRILYMTEVTFSWFPLLKDLQISYTFRTLELHHPQEHNQRNSSVCPFGFTWIARCRPSNDGVSGGCSRVGKGRRPRGCQRSAGDEAVTLN